MPRRLVGRSIDKGKLFPFRFAVKELEDEAALDILWFGGSMECGRRLWWTRYKERRQRISEFLQI